MRLIFCGVLVLTWAAAIVRADVVTFKNGDKLTGALVKTGKYFPGTRRSASAQAQDAKSTENQ